MGLCRTVCCAFMPIYGNKQSLVELPRQTNKWIVVLIVFRQAQTALEYILKLIFSHAVITSNSEPQP